MEKGFIVGKESTYYKDLKEYSELAEQQRKFVHQFFKDKGIESKKFYMCGNGAVNEPFGEYSKNEIKLYIVPTENDFKSFGKMLTNPIQNKLQSFRKNSSIGKEFAERCVQDKVIINLRDNDLRDYFKSIGWKAYSYEQFEFKDKIYLKVSSDLLKEDDVPEGFTEIKLSEYYIASERFNEKNNDK